MKKIGFLFALMLAAVPSAVFGADRQHRSATLIDNAGMAWEIRDVFIHSEPCGFYKSRFCLTVIKDIFRIAIPPENLISVEVEGENCVVTYRWMGRRQTISGMVASKRIGGESDAGYVSRELDNLKKLTFKEEPHVMKGEIPPAYEATLVLADGTRVPVAKLIRISAQPYAAAPLSGAPEGIAFEPHNDLGFLRGETAPTIRFEDIKSMEFPTENSITLTLKRGIKHTQIQDEKDNSQGNKDEDFLLDALKDLGEGRRDTSKTFLKNWAYGFTGICSKGYFFMQGKHVKAIEFSVDQHQ